MTLIKWSNTCDCCGEYVKSPYSFRHEDVWYSGHKRCMGAPMIRKLSPSFPPIALCGRLRSGKDTVAEYLAERYGYVRFAFGDEIKRFANELFPDESAAGRKPRELYQWFGQTMRQRDPDVWVRKCFDTIKYRHYFPLATALSPPVITDLRQPNEFARCRTEGFVIIRITRPEPARIAAASATDSFTAADLRHETEQHTDGFAVDYEIANDGTLAELYAKVDNCVSAMCSAA